MRIILVSCGGAGCWFMLRLMREGHQCDWIDIDHAPRTSKVLKGLIPPPLKQDPNWFDYDLCIFDVTGNGDMADEIAKQCPVIGDSMLASRLEDDRLFGIETMEQCGIEVPAYETFTTPEEAKAFIAANPKRYVYKPFTVAGKEQPCDTTYVADSVEDLMLCLDGLFAETGGAPFLLQEVVQGVEIAANGYFDGSRFHFVTHTIEEKKLMSGSHGPNTGCAGNLIYWPKRDNLLIREGLGKLAPFLKESGYRGMIDLNTIVNESHAYGLEFTPRFGYDSSATEFSMLDGDLGQFLFEIATAPEEGYIDHDPTPPPRGRWAAAARLTVPPYPDENADFDDGLPIKGVDVDSAWRNCFLYDAMLDKRRYSGEEGLVTVGLSGLVACPIAAGNTPEGAWNGVERLRKTIKFPNLQMRDDLQKSTMKRLQEVMAMGWIS